MRISKPVPATDIRFHHSPSKAVYERVLLLSPGEALPVKCDDLAEAKRLQHAAEVWGNPKTRSARIKVRTRIIGCTLYIWPHQNGYQE